MAIKENATLPNITLTNNKNKRKSGRLCREDFDLLNQKVEYCFIKKLNKFAKRQVVLKYFKNSAKDMADLSIIKHVFKTTTGKDPIVKDQGDYLTCSFLTIKSLQSFSDKETKIKAQDTKPNQTINVRFSVKNSAKSFPYLALYGIEYNPVEQTKTTSKIAPGDQFEMNLNTVKEPIRTMETHATELVQYMENYAINNGLATPNQQEDNDDNDVEFDEEYLELLYAYGFLHEPKGADLSNSDKEIKAFIEAKKTELKQHNENLRGLSNNHIETTDYEPLISVEIEPEEPPKEPEPIPKPELKSTVNETKIAFRNAMANADKIYGVDDQFTDFLKHVYRMSKVGGAIPYDKNCLTDLDDFSCFKVYQTAQRTGDFERANRLAIIFFMIKDRYKEEALSDTNRIDFKLEKMAERFRPDRL